MTITFNSNIRDFSVAMSRISGDMQSKTVRRATSAAGSVFRAAVKKAAGQKRSSKFPKPLTGTMARAVYLVRDRKESTAGAERFIVGIRSGKTAAKSNRDAFYWRFLEGGWIPRGPGKALKGGRRIKALRRSRSAGRRVKYPFVLPAFQASSARAVDVFQSRLDREFVRLNNIR